MKTTIFKPILLMTFGMIAFTQHSFASGDKQGNGGADIVKNGHHYLLDLVEAGIQDDAYVQAEVKIDESIAAAVKLKLSTLVRRKLVKEEVLDLVTQKISEISVRSKVLGKIYQFVILNSQVNLPDESLKNPYLENSVMIYNQKRLKRVAVRVGSMIYVNPDLLKKFNSSNQAALFVHEWTSNVLGEKGGSDDTRALIGALFTQGSSEFVIRDLYRKYGFSFVFNSNPSIQYSVKEDRIDFVDTLDAAVNPYYFYNGSNHLTDWRIGKNPYPFTLNMSSYRKMASQAKVFCTEAVVQIGAEFNTSYSQLVYTVSVVRISVPAHIFYAAGGARDSSIQQEIAINHNGQPVKENECSSDSFGKEERVKECVDEALSGMNGFRNNLKAI